MEINNTISNEDRECYVNYSFTCSEQDRELWNHSLEYEEEYFEDMRFQHDSILSDYLNYESELGIGGCDYYFGLDANCIRFSVEELTDFVGGFEKNIRKVTITPKHKDDKRVILHEMIHVYEFIVSESLPFFSELLLFNLYRCLQSKIADLDARILEHAHTLRYDEVLNIGGPHGILFFLKSIDLDLRCGYKLGTVCGYGRDKQLE